MGNYKPGTERRRFKPDRVIDDLTPKEIQACQMFALGVSRDEVIKHAYPYTKEWEKKAISSKAYQFMNRKSVKKLIRQLKEDAMARHRITVDDLIDELEEHRQIAISIETPQLSAANAATMGKAKLLGFDKNVIDHTSSDGSMTPKSSIDPTKLSNSAMEEILNARNESD